MLSAALTIIIYELIKFTLGYYGLIPKPRAKEIKPPANYFTGKWMLDDEPASLSALLNLQSAFESARVSRTGNLLMNLAGVADAIWRIK
jgi:hypothetical protein